jgi:hypothetical protein
MPGRRRRTETAVDTALSLLRTRATRGHPVHRRWKRSGAPGKPSLRDRAARRLAMGSGPLPRRRIVRLIAASRADLRSVAAGVTGTAPRPRWNPAATVRSAPVRNAMGLEPMAADVRNSICASRSCAVRRMADTVSRVATADTAVERPQATGAVRAAATEAEAGWVAEAADTPTAVEVAADTPAAVVDTPVAAVMAAEAIAKHDSWRESRKSQTKFG